MPSSITLQLYPRNIARQRDDGAWFTIDERPPQSWSHFTATALAMRGMQLYAHSRLADETAQRVARARDWLLKTKPRDTEDRTFQLLGLAWAGTGDGIRQQLAAELLAQHRPDGAWAQMPSRTSDAYATGEALVALHDAGDVPANSTAYRRGVRFLLDQQKPDGSWFVMSRIHPPALVSPPYFESGFPYGHNQF